MYYNCYTMILTQLRIPEGLLNEVNSLVDKGYYSSKSDVIRDAVRRLVLEKQIGSIPNTRDSVKEIRAIRKKLAKQKTNINKINSLGK